MYQAWSALTGVYLRRVAMFAAPSITLAMVLPWLFVQATGLDAGWTRTAANPLGLYFNFLGATCAIAGLSAWAPLPDLIRDIRLATLPQSNNSIGSFLWLMPGAVVAVCSLALLLGCQLVFTPGWPILTSVLGATAFSMLSMACGCWLKDFRWYRLMAVVVVLVSWGAWFVGHSWPHGFRQPSVPWFQVAPIDLLILALTLAASWRLQLVAWTRMRCADTRSPWLFSATEADIYQAFDGRRQAAASTAATPYAGLLQLEWRRTLPLAVIGGLVLAAFGMLMLIAILQQQYRLPRLLAPVMMQFGMGGFVMGLLVAADWAWSDKRPGLRTWVGVLPLSSRDLSRVMLWTLARSLVVIIPIALSGVVITVLAWRQFMDSTVFTTILASAEDVSLAHSLALLVVAFAVGWGIGGVTATVTVRGRTAWVSACYFGLLTIPAALGLLDEFAGGLGEFVASWLRLGIVAATLLTTAACFVMARQRRLIVRRTPVVCCLAGGLLGWILWTMPIANEAWSQLKLSVAALAVVPFASVPLALNWNRHG